MNKEYFVYIVTNYGNTVFYTGITNNLERRIWEHKKKMNPGSFTSKYKIYKLVWFTSFSDPVEAITHEKVVKDMRREKKIILIKTKNPYFKDLSLC